MTEDEKHSIMVAQRLQAGDKVHLKFTYRKSWSLSTFWQPACILHAYAGGKIVGWVSEAKGKDYNLQARCLSDFLAYGFMTQLQSLRKSKKVVVTPLGNVQWHTNEGSIDSFVCIFESLGYDCEMLFDEQDKLDEIKLIKKESCLV